MPRIFLFLLVCLSVASCTPSSEAPELTSSSVTVPSSTTTTTLGPSESLAAFDDCLQQANVLVGSPATGGDSAADLTAMAAALDTTDPQVQAAVGECASVLSTFQRAELAADPEVRQLVVAQLEAFAACMRAEGVTEFPDPSDGIVPGFEADVIPFDDDGFDTALERCRGLVGGFGLEG